LTDTAPTDGQLKANDFIFEPHAVCLFQVRDIVCLKPARPGNMTELTIANGRKLTIRKAMTHIIPRLPSFFFLVRRGWVINLYHVRDMQPFSRRAVNVTLSDFSEVLISRQQLLELGREWGL
jgi:DNA-binding LytR/AlgR family response regulator